MRILLLDDEDAAILYHTVMIEDAGLDVEQVQSFNHVDRAIAYLKDLDHRQLLDQWPEYIFLDINMPVKSGFDFIDEFRAIHSDLPHPTIYFVSSSSNPEDIRRVNSLHEVEGLETKFLESPFFEALKRRHQASES